MNKRGLLFLICIAWVCSAPLRADEGTVATVMAMDGPLYCERVTFGRKAVLPQLEAQAGDVFSTTAIDSMAAFDLHRAGKIGLASGTTLRTLNPGAPDPILNLDRGTLLGRIEASPSPIRIQTRHYVLDVQGAEFLVTQNAASEGDAIVDVFEGRVTCTPRDNGASTVAEEGARVVLRGAAPPIVTRCASGQSLRKQDADYFKLLFSGLIELGVIKPVRDFTPVATRVACQMDAVAKWASANGNVVNNPPTIGRANDANRPSSGSNGNLIGKIISIGMRGFSHRRNPSAVCVTGLCPEQTEIELPPRLEWNPEKNVRAYVVFVSKNETLAEESLDFAAQVRGSAVDLPSDGPRLEPGKKYYWRVVAIGEDGKPRGKASQTWFNVPADDHRS